MLMIKRLYIAARAIVTKDGDLRVVDFPVPTAAKHPKANEKLDIHVKDATSKRTPN